MVTLASLWLPVLLATVFVFLASFALHMVVGHHFNDVDALPDQKAAMDALRPLRLPPGDYVMPRPAGRSGMKDPAFQELAKAGPVARLTVYAPGMAIGKGLVQWFFYVLVVGLCCAYIASRELAPGAHYLAVFRLAGFAAFMGYSLALPQASIWYGRTWRMTFLTMADGLVYALLTGGTFGWLWPH